MDVKKKAIICDLDGTLSLLNGRDPYDASTCDNDLLNPAVAAILEQFTFDSYEDKPPHSPVVILCSGRFETFRPQTIKFLKKYKVRYDKLFMREAGDMRNDAIVKKEIYDNLIEPKYDILFVLDDRNRVVDMWRETGLTCLQVAPGNF